MRSYTPREKGKNKTVHSLNHFDVLMSKIIFKKYKNIILMHFLVNIILKNDRNQSLKLSYGYDSI